MRLSAFPAILLAGLALSGCISGSDTESVLSPGPSAETTGAVAQRSGPVPAADIGGGSAQSAAQPAQGLSAQAVPLPAASVPAAGVAAPRPNDAPELAWAGNIPQPQAFATTAMTVGMPVPSEKPVAALVAPEPPVSTAPQGRSRIYSRQFRDAKPINFGKSSPKKYAVHGVDVSRWQGDIDWPKLRTQGANFAYIKATDGGDHIDPMFKTNWRKAKEAGIRRGAYHFFYWCRTAGEQADWFIRNVPRDPDALPPVIDVEYNHESSCKRRLSVEKVREKMQVFMDKLERHYGKRPVIYTAPDFYKDNLRNAFLDYPFWLRSVAAHPAKVYPGRKWLFWQYSGSGLSHGVNEKIDLNVFRGGEADWHQWVNAGRS
ncbi:MULTISPECIES: glycoside hydrolase family 25 protein [Alphaproteobacteria]|uniref:Glycosyl transferase n=2 Tax=Alphaproteobacteria TaxID=28211 RepID=A0A512HFV6_9HYPH|nr:MULTISPECIES: GH25 family lysozyme [Alphaproteobacteria]GEO84335.1 glycosyl transferase [Ciceribacter naphthalenivorans]GLR24872.1 glycosyl transferase [Ciceribacter naphthalenivorans]GLT07728.1 glycosyl transferase [Sphingomonas psychrolutea]